MASIRLVVTKDAEIDKGKLSGDDTNYGRIDLEPGAFSLVEGSKYGIVTVGDIAVSRSAYRR